MTAPSADLAVRHATYYRRWLEQTGNEWETLSTGTERAPYFAGLNNVRAALEWCFGENGNASIGVELAAAAAPVFLAMSLLLECHRWSERALLALDDARRGGREEMQLQAGFGISLMFTRGNSEPAHVALNRSLAIAEERSDAFHMAGMLGMLHLYHLRSGDYHLALQHARAQFHDRQQAWRRQADYVGALVVGDFTPSRGRSQRRARGIGGSA